MSGDLLTALPDLATPLAQDARDGSFLARNRDLIAALVTVAGALVVARLVDRAFVARGGRRVAERMAGGEVSAAAQTRLRLVRRLVFVLIVLVGVALALSQFEGLRRLATGVLASSAVLGLVVGFAARVPIANAVAGVLLVITQPIRIGDLVTFEDDTGTVEDVRLTYTFIRLGDGTRLVIPNERLAQAPIENHTLAAGDAKAEASVWLPPGADASRALEVLSAEDDVEARVAEVDKEGIRLAVTTWAETARERGPAASRLRRDSLQRLRDASLSSLETG